MNLKRIEISRLMDTLPDEEFEPKEEIIVDAEKIKGSVMEKVSRKRRPALRRAGIAAAVLAACLCLAAFTYGEKIYQMFSGAEVSIGENGGEVRMNGDYDEASAVVSLENGRLWFVADGQRVDITDLVDDETPYIYTRTDEDGNFYYAVVGGTPEDYGWFNGVKDPDGLGGESGSLHSREDLSDEEKLTRPAWHIAGVDQVETLRQEQTQTE